MLFCDRCGRKAQGSAAPAQRDKSRRGLFAGFGLGAAFTVALLLTAGVLLTVTRGGSTPAPTASPAATPAPAVALVPFPAELKAGSGEGKVSCQFQAPDHIVPANYRSLGYVALLQCSTDGSGKRLSVSVEIPEFTQKSEQIVDVTRERTVLAIHPPLLQNAAQVLSQARDAQVNVTVKDADSGETVFQASKPVRLYAFNDMQWEDESGTPYYENILAWVTPNDPKILQMLRDSDDSCNVLTNGGLNAIVGYQQVSDWSHDEIVEKQVEAMMYTLAEKYSVQYTNTSFSSTSTELQRIATPAEVIGSHAGVCIETAVTMASAIQSTGMHAVILLLPGHAQVAVETWEGSGEYILIETTALDRARARQFEGIVCAKLTRQQWNDYMSRIGTVAIDCDLAGQWGISPVG